MASETQESGAPQTLDIEMLLPSPASAPSCSVFAVESGSSPWGTANHVDAVVCVDLPEPWPKPVFAHPELAGFRSMFSSAFGWTRLLTRIPTGRASTNGPAGNRSNTPPGATVWWRDGGTTRVASASFSTPEDRLRFLTELRDDRPTDLVDDVGDADTVLVCVQGTHDLCCGRFGNQLADELDAAGIANQRVSHLGGHRFAPTVMTMSDGRMWAWVRASEIKQLCATTVPSPQLLERCRGWWGAEEGPEQIAELAVWQALASDSARSTFGAHDRTIVTSADAPTDGADSERWRITVSTPHGDRWDLVVHQGRPVPVIACEHPGGVPYKVSYEFDIVEGPTPRHDEETP